MTVGRAATLSRQRENSLARIEQNMKSIRTLISLDFNSQAKKDQFNFLKFFILCMDFN